MRALTDTNGMATLCRFLAQPPPPPPDGDGDGDADDYDEFNVDDVGASDSSYYGNVASKDAVPPPSHRPAPSTHGNASDVAAPPPLGPRSASTTTTGTSSTRSCSRSPTRCLCLVRV